MSAVQETPHWAVRVAQLCELPQLARHPLLPEPANHCAALLAVQDVFAAHRAAGWRFEELEDATQASSGRQGSQCLGSPLLARAAHSNSPRFAATPSHPLTYSGGPGSASADGCPEAPTAESQRRRRPRLRLWPRRRPRWPLRSMQWCPALGASSCVTVWSWRPYLTVPDNALR